MNLKVMNNLSLCESNQNGGFVPLVEVGGTGQVATGWFAHCLLGSILMGSTENDTELPVAQEKETNWNLALG